MTLNIEDWRNYQNECHNWVATVALSFYSLNNLDPQALAHIFFFLFLVAHINRHSAINSHLPVICFCSGRNAGRWCQGQSDKGTCYILIFGISISIFWFLPNLSVILWHFWAYFRPALGFPQCTISDAVLLDCDYVQSVSHVSSSFFLAAPKCTEPAPTEFCLSQPTSYWLSCFLIKNVQSTGVQSCPFSEVYQHSKLVRILGVLANKT